MQDIDTLVRGAQSKVSSTISALESAITTWDGMEKKPEEHAETIAAMKKLLPKLEAWTRKSLKNGNASREVKERDLRELISLSDSSKGDF